MKKSKWFWLLLIVPMLFIACGGDDDDDNDDIDPYVGPTYRVRAEFEMPDDGGKDSDSLIVEVRRLDPEADSPDMALIIINGIELGLVEYDALDSTAYYWADGLTMEPDGSYRLSFYCGDDSAAVDFYAPPTCGINLIAPVVGIEDTLPYPSFDEGEDIPIEWEYTDDTPANVEVRLIAINAPNQLDYIRVVPGNSTTYTFPGDSTHGLGGPTFPLPTITVIPTDGGTYSGDDLEIDISVTGMPAFMFVYIANTDTINDVIPPTVTVSGGIEATSFNWDPPLGASAITVYRDSGEDGGAIWTLIKTVEEGFGCPLAYGATPENTMTMWGPTESIQTGERYSCIITFQTGEDEGVTGVASWTAGGR